MSRRPPLLTLAVALLTVVVLVFVPGYHSESCVTDAAGPVVCTSENTTLIEHEGTSVLLVLLVPAAIAAIGVARPTHGVLRGVAIALTVCIVLGAMSIGIYYVPTLLVAWIVVRRRTVRAMPRR
jgi:hypothetical protein